MSKGDRATSIQELKDLVIKFRDDRGWKRHHTPKNVAISMCLETAELFNKDTLNKNAYFAIKKKYRDKGQ